MYDSGFGKRQDNYVRRKAQCQRKAAADRNTDDKQLCVPSDFCLWQKDLVRLQDTRLPCSSLTVTHGFRGFRDAASRGCTRAHPFRLAAYRLWLLTLTL